MKPLPPPRPLGVPHFLLAKVPANHSCPALALTPPHCYALPSAHTDWSSMTSRWALLCADWTEFLSVAQLRLWRRWRPFWSRARGRTELPLAAMAAPLGTGALTEEAGQEKQDTQEKDKTIPPERAEEAKLKAKYPNLGQKPGGSDFLMKRLQKGQKYFDSGDYNMAKAKMKNKQLPSAGPDKNLVTGDHIPTPQDLPQRKSSLVTSKLAG